MKNNFFWLTFFLFTSGYGQTMNFDWAKAFTGSSNGDGDAHSLCADSSGNVYSTGEFSGTLDFDPGVGTYNLTSFGNDDIFISKLNNNGELVWIKQMGGISKEYANSIAIDQFGFLYVTGRFEGTVDFDAGFGVYNLTPVGNRDIFVLKLDTSGNFIWVKQIGGTQWEEAYSLVVDASSNIYITGYFGGTVDFDPGAGVYNLSVPLNGDVFVSKLDSSGDLVWAKQLGGSGYDFGHSIAVDNIGNVYTTGRFELTADFDPDTTTSYNLTSEGNEDVFISKLNNTGNFLWAKRLGGKDVDNGNSIIVSDSGYVYTTGFFKDTVDFDTDTSILNYISKGYEDIFISKLDSSGDLIWAKQLGGPKKEVGISIAIDAMENVYTVGEFIEITDFDPGVRAFNVTSLGNADIFVLKLNSYGDFECVKQIGATSAQYASSIFIDTQGNIYTSGTFYGVVDFNPGGGVFNLTSSSGDHNIFIHKMNPCISSYYNFSATACYSYTLGSQTYTQNGLYAISIDNTLGCDSIITLDLALKNTVGYLNDSACTNYISPSGKIWSSSGVYKDTIPNLFGCDSLITVFLKIKLPHPVINRNGLVLSTYTLSGATYQWLDCNSAYAPIASATNYNYTVTASGSYAVVVSGNSCIDTSSCYIINLIGFPEIGMDYPVSIFPNPSNGILNISVGMPNEGRIKIELMDILGKETFVLDKTFTNGKYNFVIGEKEILFPGIYLVRININETQMVKRVVIQ